LPYLSGDDVTFTLLLWCSRVAAVYRNDYKMGKVKGMCAHLVPAAASVAYLYIMGETKMCKWGMQLFRQLRETVELM